MAVWLEQKPLILASQSQVRQTLLANAGLSFEAKPAAIDERAIQKNSGLVAAGEIAAHLAREKARFVSLQSPGRYVIGADQTLECDGRLFNKPAGRAGAIEHLHALAGRTHALHAAIAAVYVVASAGFAHPNNPTTIKRPTRNQLRIAKSPHDSDRTRDPETPHEKTQRHVVPLEKAGRSPAPHDHQPKNLPSFFAPHLAKPTSAKIAAAAMTAVTIVP